MLAVAMLCGMAIRQKDAVPLSSRVFFPQATNFRNLFLCYGLYHLNEYVVVRDLFITSFYVRMEFSPVHWIDDGYIFIHFSR